MSGLFHSSVGYMKIFLELYGNLNFVPSADSELRVRTVTPLGTLTLILTKVGGSKHYGRKRIYLSASDRTGILF